MSDQDQQYPYPPAPPYAQVPPAQGQPPQGGVVQAPVPPRPVPMKMPAGMKMPPRPMGYPMPAGMKMPPRPMVGMPPVPGQPMIGQPMPTVPVPVEAPAGIEPPVEEEPAEEIIVPDENGIIDDLVEEIPEKESEEEEFVNPYDKNFASDLGLPPAFIRTPMLLFLFVLFMSVGAGLGLYYASLDSRGAEELPGVVANSEIPKGRPRCGIAQKGQGCVLYIMNAQRKEMEAKDFFGIASDMLQVPKFQIETANIRYATTRIPPGYIALFNIPPVQ